MDGLTLAGTVEYTLPDHYTDANPRKGEIYGEEGITVSTRELFGGRLRGRPTLADMRSREIPTTCQRWRWMERTVLDARWKCWAFTTSCVVTSLHARKLVKKDWQALRRKI